MEGRYGESPDKSYKSGPSARHVTASGKKAGSKNSQKVAPLVAALNEQAAAKGLHGNHLSEQAQLLLKNKKKANQQKRK